jgi:hypothetical protein
MSRNRNEIAPPVEYTGCLAGFVRILWFAVGNGALLLLAVLITERKAFSGLDIAFWAIVVALIFLRYIDITRLNGLTSDGEPASLQHWRRYVLLLLMIAGGVWALAHGITRLLAS